MGEYKQWLVPETDDLYLKQLAGYLTANSPPFKHKYLMHCLLCDDTIFSEYEGEMKWCKCNSCAIDETSHYYRAIGEVGKYVVTDKIGENT